MYAADFPARKFSAFALLSATDFALTWYLLGQSGAGVYEVNPLAAWWLQCHGWAGLAVFKVAIVLLTAALILGVCQRRPRSGHRLLAFGCAVLLAVVVYSGYLAWRREPSDASSPTELRLHAAGARHFDAEFRRNDEYRAALNRACTEVIDGRCSLAEAASRLAETEKAADPAWIARLRGLYPGLDYRACLAASIVRHALRVPHLYPTAPRVVERLREELRAMAGAVVPLEEEGVET